MATKLISFHRFSGDFGDRYNRSCNIKNIKNQDYKESVNGYAPYFEYALDYSPPNDGKASVGSVSKSNSTTISSATLPHYSNPASTTCNMSLPRNRNDIQQQSLNNGFLGMYSGMLFGPSSGTHW